MNSRRFHRGAGVGALLGLAVMASATAAENGVPDALVPVEVKHFDEAWEKPGADLAAYTAVLIRPATVTFSSNWRPRDYGSSGLRPDDVERLRTLYAKVARDTFVRVLSDAGYRMATEPASHVLELRAEITDLHVNGPDAGSDALVRTYVRSAADMRLQLTLLDASSGAVLFRASDFRRGRETGQLQWATSVYNRVEAEQTFAVWARQLRSWLGR